MNNADQYTDEDIVAYLAGDLDAESATEIAVWINASDAAKKRVKEFQILERELSKAVAYAPPNGMLVSFRKNLANEMARATDDRGWYRIAAAIVLTIAGFAAGRITADQDQRSGVLAALQDEVRSLQQLVMLNTLQDHSASERLQAIHAIDESSGSQDAELIRVLIRTMNNDASPNVRYAAILALDRYAESDEVRTQLVRALKIQEDPLVQIALIRILTDTREKAAIAPLRKFINNANTPPDVRRAAEIALNSMI